MNALNQTKKSLNKKKKLIISKEKKKEYSKL